MNINFALEIIAIALSIVKTLTAGNAQQSAGLAAALVQIISKAMQAYQQETGQPLDVSLIKAEPPL